MSGRAVSTRDSSRVPSTARLLLGGALVLVLGATLILVLTDDARFLKMGILAALWAALVGAFLAARFRRQVADKTDESQSMQAIYELELEREIAARREYELELEADAKRKAEEQSRADIEALRTELGQLRETLQTLLGGEVLVERFALQAQATRMRSLPDEKHQLPQQGQVVKRLNPAASAQQPVIIPSEPQTELIDRVAADRPRAAARPQPQRPQPQRPPREPAERQVQIRQPRRDDPANPGSGWWDPVTPVGPYHQPVAGDSANSLGEGIDPGWTPSWERSNTPPPQRQQPPIQQHSVQQATGRPPRPPKQPQPSQPMQRPEVESPTRIQPLPETAEPTVQRPVIRESVEPTVQRPVVRTPEPPPPPPPVRKPEPASRVVQMPPTEEAGGRRRAPEVETTGGGRRRKADDAPSWQETFQARQQQQPSGSHAKPPAPPAEQTGSHAAGKSVNELLAAHGASGETPRRRRRKED
ncbi:hypothetical protein LWC34_41425 [Kibdelosporangium philippinense]|uniref:DUF6779 domain-containing protein n=1 Tax=Kibdelosporangium philippinense TaxID=211113 RepID=A0ABS8ZNA0_9PSEU|nr:DUF6779 domain-containing protein [Kibdelosporangium philippinense]MCE7009233.1 hypothetical protein [Kibdelosporangium philippinense]